MNATDAQIDFLWKLHDRVKSNYGSDILFYDLVEKVRGVRKTEGITVSECSALIDRIKEELL